MQRDDKESSQIFISKKLLNTLLDNTSALLEILLLLASGLHE